MSVKVKHQYLHFTKKERRGIVGLIAVIMLLIAAPFVLAVFQPDRPIAIAPQLLDSLQEASTERLDYPEGSRYPSSYKNTYRQKNYREAAATNTGALFYFDPNTIDVNGWIKLGLREKTVATIEKYLAKGGRFRSADDLQKIWGLSPQLVGRLVPFVRITEAPVENREPAHTADRQYAAKKMIPIEVNQADSAAFRSLPGIGPAFARRIINFRERLGGFSTAEQVGETYGLPDSVFQKLRALLIVSGNVRQLNLNKASLEELKAHPYIRYQLAAAIVAYRQQHGNFQDIAGLKKIILVSDELLEKLRPYLVL
ncbi:MAG: helix-hairpin-helix protein [Ferruginibacter sp.]|nr:helix-hairpin-helix protein [Ferruginibacter sp.]